MHATNHVKTAGAGIGALADNVDDESAWRVHCGGNLSGKEYMRILLLQRFFYKLMGITPLVPPPPTKS